MANRVGKEEIIFRSMRPGDWSSVATIYRQGIETGNATFQTDIPTWDSWDAAHIKNCRIVAAHSEEIIGWAALTPVSGRCVYAGVAEVSVYVSPRYHGQKIGTMLLGKLISESEEAGLWTLQSSIFPENLPSLRIHLNLGFRKVGVRKKIGKMNGIWRDTVLLERRSAITGK
jgi:L-amino acid N-acyltransferase YncA